METGAWTIGAVAGAVVLWLLARRWVRRRRAAKLADALLQEVLKAKDGFRR